MHYLRSGMVALMAGIGFLGCSGEGAPSEGSGATVASSKDDPKAEAKRDNGEPLDDFQIATVMHVVNQGEIREARFALTRAARAEVRDFATRMEMEHTMADEKLRAIFGDAMPPSARATQNNGESAQGDPPPDDPDDDSEIPLAPSHTSRLFERQTVLDLQQLRPIVPPDFDLGYITKQVAAHAGVLGVIKQQLLPSVEMSELRQLIEETQPTVASHLQGATTITQTIITTTTSSARAH